MSQEEQKQQKQEQQHKTPSPLNLAEGVETKENPTWSSLSSHNGKKHEEELEKAKKV